VTGEETHPMLNYFTHAKCMDSAVEFHQYLFQEPYMVLVEPGAVNT
jgi:hypothetical protein